jgi:2-polyprenyl-3-methyl-5-hydroxy-6-metoxy-1,4-benzoquinol methylase
MKTTEVVREYFDRESRRFDAIYETRKPATQRVVDRIFRHVVVRRFELITNLAPMVGDWTVLDVGCGPGRYAIALAQAGASHVVGVDASAAMIEIAGSEARRLGVGEQCTFVTQGFTEYATDERFDVVVATGYFDYLPDPEAHLRRMIARCRGRIFASIPKKWEFRVPIRKARFAYERGFVRFYSRGQLDALIASTGIERSRVSIIDLGRDWILTIRLM